MEEGEEEEDKSGTGTQEKASSEDEDEDKMDIEDVESVPRQGSLKVRLMRVFFFKEFVIDFKLNLKDILFLKIITLYNCML